MDKKLSLNRGMAWVLLMLGVFIMFSSDWVQAQAKTPAEKKVYTINFGSHSPPPPSPYSAAMDWFGREASER